MEFFRRKRGQKRNAYEPYNVLKCVNGDLVRTVCGDFDFCTHFSHITYIIMYRHTDLWCSETIFPLYTYLRLTYLGYVLKMWLGWEIETDPSSIQ
jgi:hypothetical protein